MIKQYWESIQKLEERRKDLYDMVSNRKGCLSDLLKRIEYIDIELEDLYAVYRYLTSPVPRSKIFYD